MRYSIIVLISFVISIHISFAGSNVDNPRNANRDSLHALEYLKLEYAFYAAQTEEEKYDALWQKVQLAAYHKENAKLLYEIKRLENLNENLKLKKELYWHAGNLMFNLGLYNSCLEFINKDSVSKFKIEKSFIKTLCFNQEEQYGLMLQEIRKTAQFLNKDTSEILKQLQLFQVKSSEKKSVLLQAILPGAGMINEGELNEGFTSFILNGIFITAPILLISKQFYFSAFSYGIMPFSKFYGGGIRHTRYLAEGNREKKLEEIKQKNAALLYNFFIN
jgi:hypothetical protein